MNVCVRIVSGFTRKDIAFVNYAIAGEFVLRGDAMGRTGRIKMKLTKKQNPFDVQIGQTWKAKDRRRPQIFRIVGFEKTLCGIAAIGEYINGFNTMVNLLRFSRYVRIK